MWENKTEILKEKKSLVGQPIYIDDDRNGEVNSKVHMRPGYAGKK